MINQGPPPLCGKHVDCISLVWYFSDLEERSFIMVLFDVAECITIGIMYVPSSASFIHDLASDLCSTSESTSMQS
jgi:hypothetical protein